MKIKIPLIFMAIIFVSCGDDEPVDTRESIDVELLVNELYEYNTNIGGDEEGAKITEQASHFEISEMIRNESTMYVAVYRYQPSSGYVGTDEVEMVLSTGSNGESPSTHEHYIRINFTISD